MTEERQDQSPVLARGAECRVEVYNPPLPIVIVVLCMSFAIVDLAVFSYLSQVL